MFDKLDQVERRFGEIDHLMTNPAVIQNVPEYLKLTKERAQILPVVEAYRSFKKSQQELEENELLLQEEKDPEMREMAKEEIGRLKPLLPELKRELELLLLPKDPHDERNILLEIRAGTGGDEASLFASDLMTMYQKYAASRSWKIEILSFSPGTSGGYKEIICMVSGNSVYSSLKYESGVHRVQRVPKTETQGRVHTSTVTVAVIPEADEVEVKIEAKDLQIDVYRSGGAGGQSVNTTDSAVRITHLPTGVVVAMQDERSQLKNKDKAMKVLKSRLYEKMENERKSNEDESRKSQVGTGERAEKIRTYNYPQSRISDHRINLTLYNLAEIMDGNLEQIIVPLRNYYQAEALKQMTEQT